MNPLFVVGVLVVGYFLYQGTVNSMKSVYSQQPGDMGEIAGYHELSDAAVDPRNFITNTSHMPIVRTEEGQFGCPRVIYKGGDKGSNITTYGNFYRQNF